MRANRPASDSADFCQPRKHQAKIKATKRRRLALVVLGRRGEATEDGDFVHVCSASGRGGNSSEVIYMCVCPATTCV